MPGLKDIVACDSPSITNLPPATVTTYSTIAVLFSKFIVLFVNVSVELSVTTVESIAKVTAFPEPEVSIPVPPVNVNVSLSKSIANAPPLSAVKSKSCAVT